MALLGPPMSELSLAASAPLRWWRFSTGHTTQSWLLALLRAVPVPAPGRSLTGAHSFDPHYRPTRLMLSFFCLLNIYLY